MKFKSSVVTIFTAIFVCLVTGCSDPSPSVADSDTNMEKQDQTPSEVERSEPEDSATTETPSSGIGEAPSKKIETVWRLAHEGQTTAQSSLATFYLLGHGVPEDAVEAFAWLTIAHASGDASVVKNYELVKSRLSDEQLEQSQKRAAELQSKISR